MRRHAYIVSLVASVLVATIGSAEARTPTGSLGHARDVRQPHSLHRVIVELAPGGSPDVLGRRVDHLFGRWFEVPVSGGSPLAAARRLAATPGVATAELDLILSDGPTAPGDGLVVGPTATPGDPGYQYQWHFPPLQLESAWDDTHGAGAIVAIVDSGVSLGGEDLDCHTLVSPYNAVTDAVGSAVDDNGHGTHVAGTATQCTNNGLGVAGVASDAGLMPVKVTTGGEGTAGDVAEGIAWAASHGADVINLSLGAPCTQPWPACSSSILNDAIAAATQADVPVVVSSGNGGSGVVSTPANHPDAIAVGAVRYDLQRSFYSNGGSALDVVAPGGDTRVDQNQDTFADGVVQETFGPSGWAYYFIQGTSMAAPHVTGAIALLRAANPSATVAEIRAALETTAMDLGAPGFDPSYGNGIIQVRAALDALGSGPAPPDVDGVLSGDHDVLGRYQLIDLAATARYRGSVDPAGPSVSFGLQVWDPEQRAWRRIASQAFAADASGSALVTIRRGRSTFADPDARLRLDARYRIRAFVLGEGRALIASDWSYFRVT